jgi:hypothetical protein
MKTKSNPLNLLINKPRVYSLIFEPLDIAARTFFKIMKTNDNQEICLKLLQGNCLYKLNDQQNSRIQKLRKINQIKVYFLGILTGLILVVFLT